MPEIEGQTLGNYHLIEKIGQGGMSSVYRAYDLVKDREVAVKVLSPLLSMDPSFKTRFKREAEALMGFDHPHIIPIIAFGEVGGIAFIVMPYMKLGGLNRRLKQDQIRAAEGARIISQIASALQYAHDRGVIHRDIKPSNVLLDENGNVWLSDFGFARYNNSSISLTGSAIIGTPAYMAPEQITGESVTASSDQYSLGVLLYRISTGYLPFDGDTPMSIAVKHATEALPAPKEVNPDLPVAIEKVLLKVLQKDPKQRFKSVAEFDRAFRGAYKEAVSSPKGRMLADDFGADRTTMKWDAPDDSGEVVQRSRKWKLTPRVTLAAILLLVLAYPVSAWMINTVIPGILNGGSPVGVAAGEFDLEATIDAIYTANAPGEGTLVSAEDMHSFVAASLTAMVTEQGTEIPQGDEINPLPILLESDPSSTPTESSDPPPPPIASATPDPKRTSTSPPQNTATDNPQTPSPTRTQTFIVSQTEPPTPTFSATVPAPTDTPTVTPSITPTPTPSNTPGPSPTNTPPPPTEDVCAKLSLSGFKKQGTKILWTVNNPSGSLVGINSVNITWPPANQRIKSIKIGGQTVWDEGSGSSPTGSGGGGTSIGAGSSKTITFTFKVSAASSGYKLKVSTSHSCQIQQSH
jgi:serine/threonine protein kinase